MQVDLTPVLDTSVSLAALALGTLGSFALARLARRLGIQSNGAAMATYDSALDKALQFGLSQLTQLISRRGWDHPDVRNATLAIALPTLVSRFPDAVRAVGLDPTSDSAGVRERLQQALERAFPQAVAQAAASPATPDATLTTATAPEQDPAPTASPAALEPDAIATLTGAVSTLVASHETTNALLGKLVGQSGAPAVEPEAPIVEPVQQPLAAAPVPPVAGASAAA